MDSNSADFASFKNRLLLKWSQCKHSKKGTVRRDWNDVDNRNGRDVLEKRQRRETEGAVFETRWTGKEDGLDVLRDVLLRLRSLSALCTCIIIRVEACRIYFWHLTGYTTLLLSPCCLSSNCAITTLLYNNHTVVIMWVVVIVIVNLLELSHTTI